MPASTKIIRTRIKSVKSTRKITKAMELVAASKMRKATEAAVNSRSYSDSAQSILSRLAKKAENTLHPLLREPAQDKTELLVVVTSDRGLCGGLNANIVREAQKYIKERKDAGVDVKIVTVGKKGRGPLAKQGLDLIANFEEITEVIDYLQIQPIGQICLDEFKNEKVDRVTLLYTEFQSALVQKPVLKTVLPFSNLLPTTRHPDRPEGVEGSPEADAEYIFEPSPEQVYTQLLPRFFETTVFQAVLEAIASEHSARMMAMRSASDAADDIVDELTLTYNQARQAAITQEIAEIAGGAAALG